MVQHPKIWEKLGLKIDGGVLTALLEESKTYKTAQAEHEKEIKAKDEELTDLGKVDEAIRRLVDVVDRAFEVSERPSPGFGISPSIPQPRPRAE